MLNKFELLELFGNTFEDSQIPEDIGHNWETSSFGIQIQNFQYSIFHYF